MNSFKDVLFFTGKFLGLYVVLFLIAVTTGLDNKVRDLYASSSEMMLGNISEKAEIKVLLKEDQEKKTNLLFQIFNKKRLEAIRQEMRKTGKRNISVPTLGFYTNSHTTVLMPLIFLLSMILVYPSDFRRKAISTITGVILILIYIYFKLACSLIYSIDDSQTYFPEYNLSVFSNKFLKIMDGLFIEGAYIIVVIIWIVVCVRVEDYSFFEENGMETN